MIMLTLSPLQVYNIGILTSFRVAVSVRMFRERLRRPTSVSASRQQHVLQLRDLGLEFGDLPNDDLFA